MSCAGCVSAAANIQTGIFGPDCLECSAPALAGGPYAYLAYERGEPGELEAQMRAIWPTAEQFRRGRIAVYRIYGLLTGGASRKGDRVIDRRARRTYG
jgi:hypothetical protein